MSSERFGSGAPAGGASTVSLARETGPPATVFGPASFFFEPVADGAAVSVASSFVRSPSACGRLAPVHAEATSTSAIAQSVQTRELILLRIFLRICCFLPACRQHLQCEIRELLDDL